MEMTSEIAGRCLVVAVRAPEVDLTVSEVFKEQVLERFGAQASGNLVLDLGEVKFMDSKAIGAMVSIRKAVAKNQGKMGLCSLHPHVAKIIKVVTLGTIFDIFPDREAALAAYCA